MHALAGIRRQGVRVALQVGQQGLPVGRATHRVTHARDAQAHRRNVKAGIDLGQHGDHLGVQQGVLAAERLGPHLPVLAEAPALRGLVPEHRRHVPELHGLRQLVHSVLGIRAGNRGRALGAQREAAAAAVVEGVHLLADDVGGGTHAAHEHLGLLEGGGDDPPEAVGRHHLGGHRLDPRAHPPLGGEDVPRALGGPWRHGYRLPVWRSQRRMAMRCANRSSSIPSGIISRPMIAA